MYTWGLLPTETEVRGGWKAEGDGGERIHTYVLRQGVVLPTFCYSLQTSIKPPSSSNKPSSSSFSSFSSSSTTLASE